MVVVGAISVIQSDESVALTSTDGDWDFTVNPDGVTATVTKFNGTVTRTGAGVPWLAIPNTMTSGGNTYTVTSIGGGTNAIILDSQISDDAQLFIPYSTTTINNSAFSNCSKLVLSFHLPDSVTSIGTGAFAGTSIDGVMFNYAHSQLTSIGDYAFYNSQLTEFRSLDGVEDPATGMRFPSTVTYIGESAFENCTGISGSVSLPPYLTTLSDKAFRTCTSMSSVVLPDTLTSIGTDAFDGCTNLNMVYNASNLPITAGSSGYGEVAANASTVESCYTITVQSNNTHFGIVSNPKIYAWSGDTITVNNLIISTSIPHQTAKAEPIINSSQSNSFSGWSNATGTINSNRTVTAVFSGGVEIYCGQTWSYTPSTTIPNATFTISGTATDWLTLSNGTISGVAPTVNSISYYDLDIVATSTNPSQTTTQSIGFTVIPYMTASVSPSTLYLKEGGSIPNSQAESLTFSYVGFGSGTYAWGILYDNGTGVEISQNGVLYGTAGSVTGGPVTVTARLTGTVDGITQTADVPFSVEIVADLEFTSPTISNVQLYVGDNWTYTVTTTLNNANITISGTASSWLTVSNGIISGTAPNDSTVTHYSLDITASSDYPTQTETMSVDFVVVPYMTASVSPNILYLWTGGPIPNSVSESITFSYTGFGTGTYAWTISNDYGTGVQIRADGTIYGTAGSITASPVTVTARLTGTVDGITQTEDVTFDVMIVAQLVFTTDPFTDGVIN